MAKSVFSAVDHVKSDRLLIPGMWFALHARVITVRLQYVQTIYRLFQKLYDLDHVFEKQ